MKYVVTFLLLISVWGCSALVGTNKHLHITKDEAKEIARGYVSSNNLSWGQPVNMRSLSEEFVFFYSTSHAQNGSVERKELKVNKRTGDVMASN